MVDGFTQAFLDHRSHPVLWDAILVREKNYFYSECNTSIERAKEVGRPKEIYGDRKGDWDFAVIYPEREHIDWYEISKSSNSSESKRHPSQVQEKRFKESIRWINETQGVDWTYETEIFFAEDYDLLFEDHPKSFVGNIDYNNPAEDILDSSDSIRALNEFNFKGRLLESDEIERR